MDQRHEEIQFRAAPEVVRLPWARGVLDNGVGHRLSQLGFLVQSIQAVPAIGVGHVQEVHRLDVVAVLFEIGGQLFKEFSLRICHKNRLFSLGAAHQKWNDEPPGFAAARRADAQQVVVVSRYHAVSGVEGVLVRVIRALLVFAQHHALYLGHAPHLQKLSHLLPGEEPRGAVGAVGQNIEAPAVPGGLITGKPLVPRPGEQAYQQNDHRRGPQAEGGEQHKPVAEGVEHPDALHHLLPGFVKGGCGAQAQGVQEHPVEVPAN